MGRDRFKGHAERVLRQPDNLFDPPAGEGYEYVRAGAIAAAGGMAYLLIWARLAAETDADLHPTVAALLRLGVGAGRGRVGRPPGRVPMGRRIAATKSRGQEAGVAAGAAG
jgi:hypothetical protein